MRVCINVGHGGSRHDPGAVNQRYNVTEHDFNEMLALLVFDDLEMEGFQPFIMSQSKGFRALPAEINECSPDVIISLHSNGFYKNVSGSECLYYSTSCKSKWLAESIQVHMGKITVDRGCKPKRKGDRGNGLLRRTNAPCVIVEPFFITTDSEYLWAAKSIDLIADAICKGVSDWHEKF